MLLFDKGGAGMARPSALSKRVRRRRLRFAAAVVQIHSGGRNHLAGTHPIPRRHYASRSGKFRRFRIFTPATTSSKTPPLLKIE
jgi:hypothetical protein